MNTNLTDNVPVVRNSLVWYASDSFATGCTVAVLTTLVCLACYQARSRRRLLRRHPTAVDTTL